MRRPPQTAAPAFTARYRAALRKACFKSSMRSSGCLQSDRQADQAVGDADGTAIFQRHSRVGRRSRVAGKRLRAAQADREFEDAQFVQDGKGERPVVIDNE